jgi:hypothetical protein
MIRDTTMDVTFRHVFTIKGLESPVPPGTYRVDIEEEQIDGLSFLAYRRLATFIRVPWPAVATRSRACWSIRRSWSGRWCATRWLIRQRPEGRFLHRPAAHYEVNAMVPQLRQQEHQEAWAGKVGGGTGAR